MHWTYSTYFMSLGYRCTHDIHNPNSLYWERITCVAMAILTNRGNDRAFRGSISRDLLNRWSAKSFSDRSSIGFRFSKNLCSMKREHSHTSDTTQNHCEKGVTSLSHWPWCRSPLSNSTVGSGTVGFLLWFQPPFSSCWSWSDLCHVCAGSRGYPPQSSGCWSGRFLTNGENDSSFNLSSL